MEITAVISKYLSYVAWVVAAFAFANALRGDDDPLQERSAMLRGLSFLFAFGLTATWLIARSLLSRRLRRPQG